MRSRYFLILCLAVTLTVASGSSVYQLIGTGGPNKFDLDLNSTQIGDSGYEIYRGLPDLSKFYIPKKFSSDVTSYTYNEEMTLNGGHVYEFQGQMELENDYDTYKIEIPGPSRIIVKNSGDITCAERYNNPRVCYIEPPGYLVDANQNLYRIGNLKIITKADDLSWKYLGTGYLLRVQIITERDPTTVTSKGRTPVTLVVPDPGKYVVLEWSGPKILKSEPEGVEETDEGRSAPAMSEMSTDETEPLIGTETWLVELVANEKLPMVDALSSVNTYQFKKDIHQNIAFENFIFEGSLDGQLIDLDLEGTIDLANHRYVINKTFTKRTFGGIQILDHTYNEYLLSNTLYQNGPDLNNGGWTRWGVDDSPKMVESLNRRVLTGMVEAILISELEFAGSDDELDCYKLEVVPPENVTREVLKEHLGSTGGLPIINATSFIRQGKIAKWTLWVAKDSGLPVKSQIKIEYAGTADGKPGSEIVVNTEEILSLYSYNQPVEIVPPNDALDSPHFPESEGLTTILDVYAPI